MVDVSLSIELLSTISTCQKKVWGVATRELVANEHSNLFFRPVHTCDLTSVKKISKFCSSCYSFFC